MRKELQKRGILVLLIMGLVVPLFSQPNAEKGDTLAHSLLGWRRFFGHTGFYLNTRLWQKYS